MIRTRGLFTVIAQISYLKPLSHATVSVHPSLCVRTRTVHWNRDSVFWFSPLLGSYLSSEASVLERLRVEEVDHRGQKDARPEQDR